jgi:YegS/Rv2252/BmrU family lipid kinase
VKTVFLVNPAAGNGAAGRRWPELAHRAAAAGLQGDTLFSERPGHLAELARTAADEKATLLVVVGGDGSVNEVANGIAGREDVEVAVIARGTGRDFVRTLGIPRDPAGAVDVALNGRTRAIDLGRVSYRTWSGDEEVSWFANFGSAGWTGAIARRANETSKALGAHVSYVRAVIAVFLGWAPTRMRVELDGSRRERVLLDVAVGNGRFLAGGMMLTPDARPDDGLFDVLLIGDLSKRELLAVLPKVFRGTHLPHPKGELVRASVVTVEADEPLPIQLDGEQPGTTPVRFEVVRAALRVRVPR